MISLLVAGDFVPSARTVGLVCNREEKLLFGEFISVFRQTDYNIVNLECPVVLNDKTGGIEKSGPHLKAGRKAVEILKKSGFQLVTLANNHFYDYGDKGVADTLETCRSLGMDTVGGGMSLQDASQIFYKKIQDKTFAFINVCENEFSIASESHGGSNPLNPIDNYYQIQEAGQNADYVIVVVHGGHEGYRLPSPRMQQTYRFFVDAGACVVIGHHTHCYSGYEIYHGAPIFYSLGNFSFDHNKIDKKWNEGYAVLLKIGEDKLEFEIIPYVQGDEQAGVRIMSVREKQVFDESIRQLNRIIADSRLLADEFHRFCLSLERSLYSYFEPYSNKYLIGLFIRHLLPSFFNRKNLLIRLNMIRCEAHRDLLITSLKNLFEK